MTQTQRFLLFILLPLIAPLLYPPELLLSALPAMLSAFALFILLGLLLWRGYQLALTLAIFIQGFNVIVRLMMFFPNTVSTTGEWNLLYMLLSLFSIGLSFYLLLRLDRVDVRLEMVR